MTPSPRSIDALVAENVMPLPFPNVRVIHYDNDYIYITNKDKFCGIVPHYSTDIAAAMDVVPVLGVIEIHLLKTDKGWKCLLFLKENVFFEAEAADIPTAICLAALKSKGITI